MSELPTLLILAGGMGTRIRALLAEGLPKSLVPVDGEPFVDRQMRLIARKGFRKVVFCVGYAAEPLIERLGNGSDFGLQIDYSSDGDGLLGTAGAIKKALRSTKDEDVAVMYGDSYLDVEYMPIYETFKQSNKNALITVYRNDGKLIKSNMLLRNGSILAYDKSAAAPKDMAHVDFGLSFYKRAVFESVTDVPMDLSVITQKLIAENQLAGYEVTTRFYEVGTPEGVRDLESYLAGKV
jgi:NDP-sugar pyrophosphorylase family protein